MRVQSPSFPKLSSYKVPQFGTGYGQGSSDSPSGAVSNLHTSVPVTNAHVQQALTGQMLSFASGSGPNKGSRILTRSPNLPLPEVPSTVAVVKDEPMVSISSKKSPESGGFVISTPANFNSKDSRARAKQPVKISRPTVKTGPRDGVQKSRARGAHQSTKPSRLSTMTLAKDAGSVLQPRALSPFSQDERDTIERHGIKPPISWLRKHINQARRLRSIQSPRNPNFRPAPKDPRDYSDRDIENSRSTSNGVRASYSQKDDYSESELKKKNAFQHVDEIIAALDQLNAQRKAWNTLPSNEQERQILSGECFEIGEKLQEKGGLVKRAKRIAKAKVRGSLQ